MFLGLAFNYGKVLCCVLFCFLGNISPLCGNVL